MFKMIGAADAAANLLWEFNIAEKKEDKLTNNKKGKVILVKVIASSIFSWALIFDKFKLFKNINKTTEDFEKKFWKAKSAESFNNSLPGNTKDPATLIFKAAMSELVKTKRQSSAVQSARVQRILEIATDNELKKVEKNFTFLATIGSTAPLLVCLVLFGE